MDVRGFILQATYRITAGRPVVHLYGRLESGPAFVLRDHGQIPHFHVEAQHREAAERAGAVRTQATALTTFQGAATARVEVAVPADAPTVRDKLHAQGIDTYEADVRFAMRYLIDRGIKGGCLIRGEPSSQQGLWRFDGAEVLPAQVQIEPRVLAFDIETDPKAQRLLAVSLYGLGADEVWVVDPKGRPMPPGAHGLPNEKSVLEAFCRRVAELDPDVLTGWNVVDFDLSVLAQVAKRVGHSFQLGRDKGGLRIRAAQGYFGSGHADIPGRLVLDGMDLLRGAFVRMDEYSLDAVARQVLGEGKTLSGGDRADAIMHRYAQDLPAFARYARTDARLALEIVEKLDVVRLAFARSQLTGMTPDRVAASIASFDFLYLSALGERGVVAPSVRSDDARVHAAQAGGAVFEPVTGMHRNVMVFDFKSLYPSLIRTFNIDPLGFVGRDQNPDHLRLVNGAAFRRDSGDHCAILPGMLDELFPRREAAKAAGDSVASQAIKILMNSFYGVLGTPACRFYNPEIANAITGQGRYFLHWSKDWFAGRDYRVLYGDTDSLFVLARGEAASSVRDEAAGLTAEANAALAAHIQQRWQVESRLELEFEKLYEKLFLPSMRHTDTGARKRYAGLVAGEVQFVGMEVVRRDWTELAKQVQRELYGRLFADEGVETYLADIVRALRDGDLDELLVYRKGLRKSLDSYTTTTPPHVAAARKSTQPLGRVISYVMTVAGPEPLDALMHAPDREHYVEKQVRPVAEPVLGALGLEFARVIGDDKQIGLF
ncbi:MAG: DNA polymerase II [Gammaproteobacteria bacterium]|nr:DNA polymerase II [Gammaproteobacteria bacterium]